jgi:hypothetical protein
MMATADELKAFEMVDDHEKRIKDMEKRMAEMEAATMPADKAKAKRE